MLSRHGKTALGTALALLLPVTASHAQQGDRKDRKGTQQIDPIPADQIPPSPYLDVDAATKAFKLVKGYTIEPVAVGEHVDMAVAIAFDANGRVWTAEMRSYMPNLDGTGEDTPNGRIRVLEDTDGDGKIDQTTTFLDGLVLPRAVAVTSDGCLYTSGDALYFTKRDGLKPSGEPVLIDADYARGGNPEHKGNGLLYGHDNWYYNAKSDRRYRRIHGTWVRQSTDMRGQWGIAKDNAGRLYHNNNSTMLVGDHFAPDFFRGNPGYTARRMPSQRLGSNAVHPIRITPGVNRAYRRGTLDSEGKLANATATCGVHIYRGNNFPREMQEMAFICEPAGDLIKAVKISRDKYNKPTGSHPYGENEFLATTDEWFLPCNIYTAPDGTMWIVDMYFGLLQHKAYMTTYLRKQYSSRGLDKPKPSTGRIYRVRYTENAVDKVPKLEGLKASELVKYLAHANGTIRDIAQRLIVESGDQSITAELTKLAADRHHPHGQIHAMWTLEGLGVFSEEAFSAALQSTEDDVTRTALNVLSLMRPQNPAIQKVLQNMKQRPETLHAHVRAMAANGLADQAMEITLQNEKVDYLVEAFISGLGPDIKTFHAQHEKLASKSIKKHLTAANKNSKTTKTPEAAHMKGEALASFKRGKTLYTTKAACFGCHGGDGEGMPNLGPPLAPSEWITESPERLAKILLHGMEGPVKVNGKLYKPAAAMPKANLTDAEFADVMTYVRNAWGNKASPVSTSLVQKTRAKTKDRTEPYTDKELR